jgi:hypothetical protein
MRRTVSISSCASGASSGLTHWILHHVPNFVKPNLFRSRTTNHQALAACGSSVPFHFPYHFQDLNQACWHEKDSAGIF